ncbi:dihydroneopterin aldolase [Solimonas fluminis]|uniref:7,8-dihydroneopterin aldolase n=1 Tax=Solimonas fluminis TaxID=2086571 RepID=A0A2S5TIS3_9GAMM|nr:dihydroneopterin aldolase [Solimonas fluminis]PPE74884.1 dihydroneopterin aldolase [Solimonas fluminis]
MDKIFLRGLEVETIIGIHAWEQRAPRPLILDLEMGTDIREAASSDQVRDAIDYAAVSAAVVKFVSETQVGLLETLAERLARQLFQQFPILSLRLAINKPGAVPGVKAMGVEIDRRREDYAACGF